MCGICGFVATSGRHSDLAAMARTLSHRGPDDDGVYMESLPARLGGSPNRSVGLGHRRLSIIDLSEQGKQPMFNENGDVALVFNGEIYNFPELRRELEAAGHRFASRTDSEVIIHGYEQWGDDVFARLNGMFAVAIWDRRLQRLTLARDRMGIKPLYYYFRDGTLLFGSELKALRSHPRFRAQVDRESLALYLDFSYVPAPRTIFNHTYKVLPGELVVWQGDAIRAQRYWTLDPSVEDTRRDISFDDAKEHCHELMRDAVSKRLVSDVALGAFLSGGYDSSLVVALARASGAEVLDTFSIGFTEDAYNEAPAARALARHLGTRHHERTVTAAQALSTADELAGIYDEPFGDPSALPMHIVSRFARESGMVVALSGDGGDELFCGYPRYHTTARLHRISGLPSPMRRFGTAVMRRTPSARFRRLAQNTEFDSLGELYHHRMSTWKDGNPYALVAPQWQPDVGRGAAYDHAAFAKRVFDKTAFRHLFHRYAGHDTVNLLSLVDIHTYLADDILTKVDRASMAVSLEARVPLLDHRLVEFAAALPLKFKQRAGVGKILLRAVSREYIPAGLLDRPKSGFAIPVEAWLRGPLRDRFERALSPGRLADEGLLNPREVANLMDGFMRGASKCPRLAWSLFMFQLWREASGAETAAHEEEDAHALSAQESVHADPELFPAGRRV